MAIEIDFAIAIAIEITIALPLKSIKRNLTTFYKNYTTFFLVLKPNFVKQLGSNNTIRKSKKNDFIQDSNKIYNSI